MPFAVRRGSGTALALAMTWAFAGGARAAGAEEFVDVTCPAATIPTRTFVSTTHHLPQPLDALVASSHAVAHEYEICAANFRSLFQLENMNYALVQQARSDVWSATVEARYGRIDAARHDAKRALDATQVVVGFKDRASDPGPDANTAGATAVVDLRHDNVPSRFDGQAKDLAKQARALIAAMEPSADAGTTPATAVPSAPAVKP